MDGGVNIAWTKMGGLADGAQPGIVREVDRSPPCAYSSKEGNIVMRMNEPRGSFAISVLIAVAALSAGAKIGGKPDLVVGEMRATGPPSLLGDHYVLPVSLRIDNRGTGSAGPFQIAILKAEDMASAESSEIPFAINGTIAGIAGKGKLDLAGKATLAPRSGAGKTIRIQAVVDSRAQVGESDEGNNLSPWLEIPLPLQVLTAPKDMQPAAFLPDLAISEADLRITPSLPSAGGEDFFAVVNIRNSGSGGTGKDARLLLTVTDPAGSKIVIWNPKFPRIRAGSSQPVSVKLDSRAFGMGEYRLEVVLDDDHKIGESDEENNVARKSFRVKGPDLSITEDHVDPPNVRGAADGRHHTFYFQARIDNNGDGDAQNVFFHIEVQDNHGERIWQKDYKIDRIPAHGYYFQSAVEGVGWLSASSYSVNILVRPNCREPNDSDNRVRVFFPD